MVELGPTQDVVVDCCVYEEPARRYVEILRLGLRTLADHYGMPWGFYAAAFRVSIFECAPSSPPWPHSCWSPRLWWRGILRMCLLFTRRAITRKSFSFWSRWLSREISGRGSPSVCCTNTVKASPRTTRQLNSRYQLVIGTQPVNLPDRPLVG